MKDENVIKAAEALREIDFDLFSGFVAMINLDGATGLRGNGFDVWIVDEGDVFGGPALLDGEIVWSSRLAMPEAAPICVLDVAPHSDSWICLAALPCRFPLDRDVEFHAFKSHVEKMIRG